MEEENFSNDPEENLRIENELVKLKMQAERGAFFGGNMEQIPPELEAQFLKNVLQFEESKPAEIETELKRIVELLHPRNIILEVLGKYELSVIYKFITDELFQEKIREVNIPGYMHSFIYEEFHPNHSVDIGRTAQEFLDHWFEKSFDEDRVEFADTIVTAEGITYPRNEVVLKLCKCLDSYKEFRNIKFMGSDTSFEWDEVEKRGLGHAEGTFKYDAEIENSELIQIEGPFKLYMINEDGFWKIFYFVFPGFAW